MATTTNYGWTTPDDTNLVKDGAAAIRTLGSSIDTTTKNLNPSTTLGDIEYRSSTANTNTRLAIGTTGQVLTVTGGVPSWATPVGGKVLQLVSAVSTTGTQVLSTSFTDTSLTASITPSSATSKILILVSQTYATDRQTDEVGTGLRIMRNSTSVHEIGSTYASNIFVSSATRVMLNGVLNLVYLDSPATTSATTYKTQGRLQSTTSSAVLEYQKNANPSTITLLEIGA